MQSYKRRWIHKPFLNTSAVIFLLPEFFALRPKESFVIKLLGNCNVSQKGLLITSFGKKCLKIASVKTFTKNLQ